MRRKNNIFFSAFVLIATFAFMLSPLSVVAADGDWFYGVSTISKSECDSKNGTVKTIFYLFNDAERRNLDDSIQTDGVYERFDGSEDDSDSSPDTFTYSTIKKFEIGLGNANSKLIDGGQGKVTVTNGSTGDKTSTTSWGLDTYYTALKSALDSNKHVKNEGNYYYAGANAWTSSSGKDIVSSIALPANNSDAIAATVNTSSVDVSYSSTSIDQNETTARITRVYQKAAFSTASVDPYQTAGDTSNYGWVWHPAVYYVQFCSVPDGQGGDTTPTSTGFKVEYDANGGVNAPATQESKDGNPVTISSTKPSNQGNTFLGWSTDPKATEPDKTYDPGQIYRGPKDLKLYAVWSPKTGVSDYLMATAIIAGVAGLGLFVSRRKKLFKQI